MWQAQCPFWSWLGCISHAQHFAESRQGLAQHLDVICPLWEETRPCGLLHIVLLQAPPSPHHVTKIVTGIRHCCVEVAAYWGERGQFILIIPSFHLPLPFHTSGQTNWRQLGPCPSLTLPQKPCRAFAPLWLVKKEGWCLGTGTPGMGALAASPMVAMCCLSPQPQGTVSWPQVHVLLCLYKFGAPMHLWLHLCSLETGNGRNVVFLNALLFMERCCLSAQALPLQLKDCHLLLIFKGATLCTLLPKSVLCLKD